MAGPQTAEGMLLKMLEVWMTMEKNWLKTSLPHCL